MRQGRRSAGACLAAAILAAPALPHDLWLVPDPPASGAGGRLVRLCSGSVFPESENAVEPDRVLASFVRAASGATKPLVAFRTEKNVLLAEAPAFEEGTLVAAVSTRPRVLELAAEAFNEYLLHDGLPDTHAWRKENGLLGRDAVERYSKHAKAVFRHGARPWTGRALEPMGLPLEIVPLADPLALRDGDELPVRVLFRGAPLAKALLGRDCPGNGAAVAGTQRTDEKGEAKVPLGLAGPFTVRLVHMTHPETPEYEWESFWASLTFEVAPKAASPAPK